MEQRKMVKALRTDFSVRQICETRDESHDYELPISLDLTNHYRGT